MHCTAWAGHSTHVRAGPHPRRSSVLATSCVVEGVRSPGRCSRTRPTGGHRAQRTTAGVAQRPPHGIRRRRRADATRSSPGPPPPCREPAAWDLATRVAPGLAASRGSAALHHSRQRLVRYQSGASQVSMVSHTIHCCPARRFVVECARSDISSARVILLLRRSTELMDRGCANRSRRRTSVR